MPSLDLFLHDRFVGIASPDPRDRSRVRLDVDNDYESDSVLLSEAFATLPGRRPPIESVTNFLGGYVPEGNHREKMAAKRRIDPGDLFGLLNEFGGSIAGAVTLRHREETVSDQPSYEELTDRRLEKILAQALTASDQGIPDDSRSTLPGYQPKVLVAAFDGQWMYPHGRAHSTHILKPQVPARPSRLFDEYFAHVLAHHLGLATFHSEICLVGRTRYLAIERFDREIVSSQVRLHHQEDLAQALGLDWRDTDVKFQSPDWPSDPKRATAYRIGEFLGSIPGGDEAVERWLRQLTFHVAIGNNDAHAKNVALMHMPTGTTLSQVYDALPNLFQEGRINWNLALAIDGVFDHRRMSVERIASEAKSWAVIASARVETVILETIEALAVALNDTHAPEGCSAGMVEHLNWTVQRLLSGSEISEPKQQ